MTEYPPVVIKVDQLQTYYAHSEMMPMGSDTRLAYVGEDSFWFIIRVRTLAIASTSLRASC